METKAVTTALPDDVLADVLSRLPARSIAVSQRVCKAWWDVVNERQLLLRLRRLLRSLHQLPGLQQAALLCPAGTGAGGQQHPDRGQG
ncbi:unnamed protein product [Urochloa humidicola]